MKTHRRCHLGLPAPAMLAGALALGGALLSGTTAVAARHGRLVDGSPRRAPVPDGWYVGITSQGEPVTLRVQRNGTRLGVRVAFRTETTCTDHATYMTGNTDYVNGVPINRLGQFRATFKGQQRITIAGQPGVDRYRFIVTGRFHGRHVSGTFYNRDDGYQVVALLGGYSELTYSGSCYTRGVRWTASWTGSRPHAVASSVPAAGDGRM